MRSAIVICCSASIFSASAIAQDTAVAPTAAPTEQAQEKAISCQLGGDCDEGSVEVGKERPFSLTAVGSTPALAPSPARGATPTRIRPVAYSAAPARTLPRGTANMALSFPSGSAQLTPASQAHAQLFARVLNNPTSGLAAAKFEIGGHTDAKGGRAYNLQLSQRRAQAVVDFLVGQGISRERLTARGYGFDKPVPGAAGTDPANRRVEIVRQ
jgi:OmpA-OmpF porin, OOP family